jgi:hypothetical protein
MSELFDDVASLVEPLSMLRFTLGLEDKRFPFREPVSLNVNRYPSRIMGHFIVGTPAV